MKRTVVSFFLSAAFHTALLFALSMLVSHEVSVAGNASMRITLLNAGRPGLSAAADQGQDIGSAETQTAGFNGHDQTTDAEPSLMAAEEPIEPPKEETPIEEVIKMPEEPQIPVPEPEPVAAKAEPVEQPVMEVLPEPQFIAREPIAEKTEPIEPPKIKEPVKEVPAAKAEPQKTAPPTKPEVKKTAPKTPKTPVKPTEKAVPAKREAAPKPVAKPAAKPDEIKPQAAAPAGTPDGDTAQAPQSTSNAAQQAGDSASAASDKPSGAENAGSPAQAPKVLDAAALKVTKKVNPDYPMISRKRKESGTAVLLIVIASGRVTSVEIEKSSGHTPLDEAAVRALREWRFDTSGYGDKVTARIPFKFELK